MFLTNANTYTHVNFIANFKCTIYYVAFEEETNNNLITMIDVYAYIGIYNNITKYAMSQRYMRYYCPIILKDVFTLKYERRFYESPLRVKLYFDQGATMSAILMNDNEDCNVQQMIFIAEVDHLLSYIGLLSCTIANVSRTINNVIYHDRTGKFSRCAREVRTASFLFSKV